MCSLRAASTGCEVSKVLIVALTRLPGQSGCAQVPLVAEAYERLAFHEAAHAAIALSSRCNLYLQETAPWTAFKKVSHSLTSRSVRFSIPRAGLALNGRREGAHLTLRRRGCCISNKPAADGTLL